MKLVMFSLMHRGEEFGFKTHLMNKNLNTQVWNRNKGVLFIVANLRTNK